MLIDEKELRVLENESARGYFREILQSYYNQNYRASIVMLFSFVIYDLLVKLKTMANEGDDEAETVLKEVERLVSTGAHYSKVEQKIEKFFKEKCSLYFKNFEEDLDLLKKYRHKCAHLNLTNDNLFQPKDYQARMLICSMFDNVFSVKAPFIRNLYLIVQTDIEKYDNELLWFSPLDEVNKNIVEGLKKQYFERLTKDSLKTSYIAFLHALFFSSDTKFLKGIFIFVYAMTDYFVKNKVNDLFDTDIKKTIQSIPIDGIKEDESKKSLLISLVYHYTTLVDIIAAQNDLFEFLVDIVLLNPEFFHMYNTFFSRRNNISAYEFFVNHTELHRPSCVQKIYKVVCDCSDFDAKEFLEIMLDAIPNYDGFSSADVFSDFFIEKLPTLSDDTVKTIVDKYLKHGQCKNSHRNQYVKDKEELEKWCNSHSFNAIF